MSLSGPNYQHHEHGFCTFLLFLYFHFIFSSSLYRKEKRVFPNAYLLTFNHFFFLSTENMTAPSSSLSEAPHTRNCQLHLLQKQISDVRGLFHRLVLVRALPPTQMGSKILELSHHIDAISCEHAVSQPAALRRASRQLRLYQVILSDLQFGSAAITPRFGVQRFVMLRVPLGAADEYY